MPFLGPVHGPTQNLNHRKVGPQLVPPDPLAVPHRVQEFNHNKLERRQVLRFAEEPCDAVDASITKYYPGVPAQRSQHRPVDYFLGAFSSSLNWIVLAPARRDLPLG